jgi:ubiquinone/menaquinone biosynthesis C-methylase UbiE
MAEPKVYDVATANISLDAEMERLYNQANLNAEKEARNLVAFGLRDGMSVLEVGSGPGFVTEWVSRLIPNGSITCVEIDPIMVNYARQHLEKASQCQYRIIESSIIKTDLPDDSFDFAFARIVFEHIPGRIEALNEIKRLLKPGGRLALTEGDYAINLLTDPHFPEIESIRGKFMKYMSSLGANRMIGREMWRLLKKAGFKNIDLEAVIHHSGDKGIECFYPQINPQRALPFVEAGVITEEEYESLRAAAEKLLASEDSFVLRLLLMACGEKP